MPIKGAFHNHAAAAWRAIVVVVAPILFAQSVSAAADWSSAQPVSVVMTEYQFAPSALTLRRGVAYRLHLENQGAELQEFTAPEFFRAVEVENLEVLIQGGREVTLQPGEKKDVYLVPRQAGRYALRCADHDSFGMVGEITIE